MQYWRDNLMPQAPALYILQRPYDKRLFPDNEVDPYAEDIFINAIDSVAIRARGAIYNSLFLENIAGRPHREIRALALGAGAGVPNINATLDAKRLYDKRIIWKEWDLSRDSVELNRAYFKEAGIPDEDVDVRPGDLKKAYALGDESIDIIDMLGLWEYLDRERCVKALSEFKRILTPGGKIIVSNMLEDRPQLDLNQRVIGWKGVKPRSVDELIEIAHDAKIDTASIRITLSDDGVYAVMEINKP
jgi:SAM-dependent methyltransferase